MKKKKCLLTPNFLVFRPSEPILGQMNRCRKFRQTNTTDTKDITRDTIQVPRQTNSNVRCTTGWP